MGLVQLHAEVPIEQRGQSQTFISEELRTDGCIDEIADRETEVAMQDAQVIIAAVEDLRHLGVRENLPESLQVDGPQRVDDEIFIR